MRGPQDGGYAAADALVALTILGAILALGLAGLRSAGRLSAAALEARRADALLTFLQDVAAPGPGSAAGHTGDFSWRAVAEATATDGGAPAVRACAVSAQAVSERTGRRYVRETLRFCAQPEAPA